MLRRYRAKLIYASYEGAYETQVDERHEYGRIACRLPAEKGGDCPSGGQNGDNEEGSNK